jgi:hypothetical protein
MSYTKFKEQFDKDYKSINDFDKNVGDCVNPTIPYNGKLELDGDDIQYDSYGNENSTLEKVYYFKDFDVYVKFSGTQQSYSGRNWDDMKEVKPVQKIINTFE